MITWFAVETEPNFFFEAGMPMAMQNGMEN